MPISDSSDPYRKASSIASSPGGAPRPPPRPGDIVGEKYRVESIIGQGGMGAVFRARHLLTERAVALKWMLPEVGGDEAVSRFLREARAMGRIDHGGVVGVLDVGVDGGATFLVMELLKGNSLRDMLEARDRFEPQEAIGLLMPALEGVEAAHRNGVVHRDLKPENIFVVRSGDGSIETTKVLDFGISKLRDDRLEQSPQIDIKGGGVVTRTGVTIGTPSYMSPEQVRGAKDIDARTDVWSLGVILYELLTGQVPFRAESFGALLVAIATEGYPPLDAVRPELPAMLVAAVHRALEKDPSIRFRDVASFAVALEPFAPKGMRFRVPDVTRLTDVSPEPASATAPTAAPVAPTPAFAATALGKVGPARPGAAPGPASARSADPSIESRGLDLEPAPRRAAPTAATALGRMAPAAPTETPRSVDAANIPSLPPLALESIERRAARPEPVAAPVPRPRPIAPVAPEPEPEPVSDTARYLKIGAALLVATIVVAIGLRLLTESLREPPPETSPVVATPETPPPTAIVPARPRTAERPPEHRPLPPWPPSTTTTAGSTTASGTSLSLPPAATIEPAPQEPTSPRVTHRGSRGGGATSSATSTASASTAPPVTTTAPATPPATSAPTMSTEPSGRTGSLSRDDF